MTIGAEIIATGLFDADWYLHRYPDIAAAGIEPAEHYGRFGHREGRAPNAYFDEASYRAQVGDIGPQLPLLHYAREGEAADLTPGPYFDPPWYRQAYSLPRGVCALADFLRNCQSGNRLPTWSFYIPYHTQPCAGSPSVSDRFACIIEGVLAEKSMPTDAEVIAASGLFDANHYLINGSDVHEASLDPIEHFCAYGWQEGRQPNIYFNTSWYLLTNPHLERFRINPLVHYILEGERQGRRPVVYFQPTWYRERYGISDNQLALTHFLENRRSQRYSPNSHFDLAWYMKHRAGHIGTNRDPFAHYLQTGTYEDIWPAADFDPAAFRTARTGRRSRHFSWLLHPNRDNPLIRFMHETYA